MPKAAREEREIKESLLVFADTVWDGSALNDPDVAAYDLKAVEDNVRAAIKAIVPHTADDMHAVLAAITASTRAPERVRALERLHRLLLTVYNVGIAVGMRQRHVLRNSQLKRRLDKANAVKNKPSP